MPTLLACGIHEALRVVPCPVCHEIGALNRAIAKASGIAWRESQAAPASTDDRRAEAVERIRSGARRMDVAKAYGVSGEMIRLWVLGRTSGTRRVA